MTKRKLVAVLVAVAMLIGGLPVSGLEANAAQKHCNNSDDCTVCVVADMINSLPEAEDIDVYNAAAVVEQIHAIDRIKVELSDDDYEEMIKLVDAENDGSGYGVDVPSKYLDAVKAINDLNAGGSLYVQKKYSVGDKELDWNKTDVILKIKCIDENTKFEPLKVTLANATDSYLGAIGAYSENADGWTNKYILPAGTYKITETGYNAVTADGEKLVTAATYDVDGEETADYAIVEVKAGEESSVAVMNSLSPTEVTAEFIDTEGNFITEAKLIIGESTIEYDEKTDAWESIYIDSIKDETGNEERWPSVELSIPDEYVIPDMTDVKILPLITGAKLNKDIDNIELINSNENSQFQTTLRVTLNKVPKNFVKVLVVDDNGNPLEGAELYINDPENGIWTSTEEAVSREASFGENANFIGVAKTPAGYYTPALCNDDGSTEAFFGLDDSGEVTLANGHTDSIFINDDGQIVIKFEKTKVDISVVYNEYDDNGNISGSETIKEAKIKIVDDENNIITEWTSDGTVKAISGLLKCGVTYTIVAEDTSNYYYKSYSDPITFVLAEDESTDNNIIVEYEKIDKYVLHLRSKQFVYGDNDYFDLDNSTCNGVKFSERQKYFFGTGLTRGYNIYFNDIKSNAKYSCRGESVPVGEYSVSFEHIGEDPRESNYSFKENYVVTISPKQIETISFNIENPVAGQELVDSVTGLPSNVDAVLKWKQNNTEVSGKAEYNTTYTAEIELSAKENYTISEKVTVKVNGEPVSASVENGKIVITQEFTTEKDTVKAPIITVSGTENNGVYTSNVTVTIESATDGATIYYTTDGSDPSKGNGIQYDGEISLKGEEGNNISKKIKAIAVKDGMNNSDISSETIEIAIPNEAPAVEITVKGNVWKDLLDVITFNKFFKETQSVSISATDSYTDIASIEYYVSDKALTEDEIKNIQWNRYDRAFDINPNAKLIIYAKATDEAGNVTIVNSEGIVLYTDSTVDGDKYEYTQDINMDIPEIKIELNGNTINSVLIGNDVVSEDDYTAAADGTIVFDREYLDSLETGNKDVTVFVDPQGVEYPRMRSTNEPPENLSIKLDIIDTKKNDDGTISADNNGDGDFDDDEDKTYIPGEKEKDPYKEVKPNDDGSYTDENNTPNDPSDDKTYIPVDKDNDGKADGLIEVKPNGDGTYGDDANGDGTFGGKGDNNYKSNGNGLFVIVKAEAAATTKTNDDFNLLLIMAIIMFTMAAMAAVVMIGRRRGYTARR